MNARVKDGTLQTSWNYVRFYALADKICLPYLQDMSLDVVAHKFRSNNRVLSVQGARNILGTLPHDCGMYKFAVDSMVDFFLMRLRDKEVDSEFIELMQDGS